MKLGCGLPMGPLALMDLIGLDTAYEILDTMYRRGGRDRRHAPVPLLKQMVTAGLLGRKSRPGLLHLRAAGLAGGRAGRADAGRRRSAEPPTARAPVAKVGMVGSGTMATGIIEVFAQGRLRGRLGDPRHGEVRARSARR